MNKFFSHPLMNNNIIDNDIRSIISFLKKKTILTQSAKVKLFEQKWSKWLGVRYSVFVNSGSSANLLSIKSLEYLDNNKNKNEIIVPSFTWSSDITSIIINGYKPVFVDINFKNLSANIDQIIKKINKKTLAVFLTHAQGFNALNSNLLKVLKKKKIFLIEDVCESHGATFNGKKLGTFGQISNFSFYYAHHMTTIEGGMISTNSKKIYELMRSLRSHGLLREINNKNLEKKYRNKYPNLSPQFIFLYKGFNVRNNEIGAVLGINQLRRLDKNIKLRNRNLKYFLQKINHQNFYIDFELSGISNYALPIILKKKSLTLRNRLEKIMKINNIEFRRGNVGGGNQLRQPYIKNYVNKKDLKQFVNVDHVHHYGYYIGNYPELTLNKINKICKILNSI